MYINYKPELILRVVMNVATCECNRQYVAKQSVGRSVGRSDRPFSFDRRRLSSAVVVVLVRVCICLSPSEVLYMDRVRLWPVCGDAFSGIVVVIGDARARTFFLRKVLTHRPVPMLVGRSMV
jgi:hypothetical protein